MSSRMSLYPKSPYHILPLLIGTTISIAGFPAYFNLPGAIRYFGLPERIASSPAAHSPWILYTSRIQAVGMMLLVFYAQGNYQAVDTVMCFMPAFAAMDVWVVVREGVPQRAWMRATVGLVCGVYGALGGSRVSISCWGE
jgi:hypothetical protein